MSVELLSKRTTRERVAACAAVGLDYWADHPEAGCVWAIDPHQHWHVVRIHRTRSTAEHACPDCAAESATYDIPERRKAS